LSQLRDPHTVAQNRKVAMEVVFKE